MLYQRSALKILSHKILKSSPDEVLSNHSCQPVNVTVVGLTDNNPVKVSS